MRVNRPPYQQSSRNPQLGEDEPLGILAKKASVRGARPSLDETIHGARKDRPTRFRSKSDPPQQKAPSGHKQAQSTDFNSNTGYISPVEATAAPARRQSVRVQHTRSNSNTGALERTGSRAKQMPKPLVDLTPQYREPPQHVKKGKAFIPEKTGAGGLIDSATSPEDPLGLPMSTDWRRDRNDNEQVTRSSSTTKAGARYYAPNGSAPSEAFTGDGLLARSGTQRNRSVDERARANGPLVDMSVPSKFAQGSLLADRDRDRQ